jgi:transcription antitermination protein NusB
VGARSKARKRAVDILFEADLRGEDPVTLIAGRIGSADVPPVNDYTVTLVEGVKTHQARIDDLISEHAEGWTLQRMPAVDRAVLRIGLYELLWATDVPDAVAIDEAIELAKGLSTDDSPRFVNGVLGRIAVIADQLRAVL